MKFRFSLVAIDALAVGTMVGAFMLYAAIQHNPQGEFFEVWGDDGSGVIILSTSIPLFLSWLIPVALIVVIAETITHWTVHRFLFAADPALDHKVKHLTSSFVLPLLDSILLALIAGIFMGLPTGGWFGAIEALSLPVAITVLAIELVTHNLWRLGRTKKISLP